MCQSTLLYVNIILLFYYVGEFVGAICPRSCHCNESLLRVTCTTAKLDYIPNTLNPALKELILNDNQIKTIQSSLSVYRDLKLFDISNNLINSLENDYFAQNQKIQIIIFNKNNITEINNSTFNKLKSLKELHIRGNRLAELGPNSFKALNKLEHLDLSNNLISKIDRDAFQGLQQLKSLNLSENLLTTIPSSSFDFVPNLTILDLGSNYFVNLPNNAFSSLNNLDELYLLDCGIEKIDAQAFDGLNSLSTLRLQSNYLEEIPSKAFSNVTELEVLQIGENNLKTINTNAFSNLKRLECLEISNAPLLNNIEENAFNGIDNLERLEISGNKELKFIDPKVFHGLPNLRYVNLRGNGFETLNDNFEMLVNDISKAILLDVRDNPFTCNCSLIWLKDYFVKMINTSKQLNFKNDSKQESNSTLYQFSSIDLFIAASHVKCDKPSALNNRTIITLNQDDFGCFMLETKIPIITAIIIGVLLVSGVVIIFVIRCKYKLSGLVKKKWFSKNTSNSRNDLNYKPDFVFIPNIGITIEEERNRLTASSMEDSHRYTLKSIPTTEL